MEKLEHLAKHALKAKNYTGQAKIKELNEMAKGLQTALKMAKENRESEVK